MSANSPGRAEAYKWYVLTVAALTHTLAVAMPTMCMPVLFKEISDDLGLSLIQIGAVWGVGSLTGMFTGLLGGSIGDRFGTRRTLAVVCALAGAAGALRGLSNSFFTLSATVLLSGFLLPAIPTNVHKSCALWFSKKRLGMANGVVSMGMALGFMSASMISATILSPLLGGWRHVLFFYGAISVLISVPWYFMKPSNTESLLSSSDDSRLSAWMVMRETARLRGVWRFGAAMMALSGAIQGTLGYLPLYLRQAGWEAAAADNALATFHGISMLAAIPIATLSDRIGSRKAILLTGSLMFALGMGLLSFVEGSMVWAAVIIAGIFRDGFMAILMTSIMETKGVGPARAGTAMGLVSVLSSMGQLFAPILGNSIAAIRPGLPFAFWAALAAAAFVSFTFIKEARQPVPATL